MNSQDPLPFSYSERPAMPDPTHAGPVCLVLLLDSWAGDATVPERGSPADYLCQRVNAVPDPTGTAMPAPSAWRSRLDLPARRPGAEIHRSAPAKSPAETSRAEA